MDLIKTLKEQHIEILHDFSNLAGVLKKNNSEIKDLSEELGELRTFLISHLELEDKLIYPKFVKSKQPELNKLGRTFSEEMLKISKSVMLFFKTYMYEEFETLKKDKVFLKEFNEIVSAVKKRVQIEETILYPTYSNFLVKA